MMYTYRYFVDAEDYDIRYSEAYPFITATNAEDSEGISIIFSEIMRPSTTSDSFRVEWTTPAKCRQNFSVSQIGIQLLDESGTMLGQHFAPDEGYAFTEFKRSAGITWPELSSNTTYFSRYYVIVDGKTVFSDKGTFVTAAA